MSEQEGVIKFKQELKERQPLKLRDLRELDSWRRIFYQTGLIGQNIKRYNGAGYGNLSQRLDQHEYPIKKRRFVITGSQTSHLTHLTERHYSTVLEYYTNKNLVIAEGPIKVSSESMTHGTIYDLDNETKFVFHSHSPEIWGCSKKLKIPTTREIVEYGTPEMADEMRRLYTDTNVKDLHIFSMGGHQDGIFTFGKTSEEAGLLMLKYLAKSIQLKPQKSLI